MGSLRQVFFEVIPEQQGNYKYFPAPRAGLVVLSAPFVFVLSPITFNLTALADRKSITFSTMAFARSALRLSRPLLSQRSIASPRTGLGGTRAFGATASQQAKVLLVLYDVSRAITMSWFG